jgi:hypothetical protein
VVKAEADRGLVVGDRAAEVAHDEVHRAEPRRSAQTGGGRGLGPRARGHLASLAAMLACARIIE